MDYLVNTVQEARHGAFAYPSSLGLILHMVYLVITVHETRHGALTCHSILSFHYLRFFQVYTVIRQGCAFLSPTHTALAQTSVITV